MKSVYLYHMRKAGGTSLRYYVDQLCRYRGMKQHVVEGDALDPESWFSAQGYSLYITSLRDPISRIKSSYLFEGRWPIQAEQRTAETALNFNDWLVKAAERNQHPQLWLCNENYYIKALTGYPRFGTEIDRSQLEQAKSVLQRFDIVLITEWMREQKTQQYLQTSLGYHQPLLHRTIPTAENPAEDPADLFPADTLSRLTEQNQLDLELFDFARQLAAERFAHASLISKSKTSSKA